MLAKTVQELDKTYFTVMRTSQVKVTREQQ